MCSNERGDLVLGQPETQSVSCQLLADDLADGRGCPLPCHGFIVAQVIPALTAGMSCLE